MTIPPSLETDLAVLEPEPLPEALSECLPEATDTQPDVPISPKPVVVIVGRPNVGKSTLVNRLVGHRTAIVDDQPGVTRDRAYFEVSWLDFPFTLIDTGGFEIGLRLNQDSAIKDTLKQKVNEQVDYALDEADVVLFVVDGQTGITDYDEAMARRLQTLDKPVFLVANKLDNATQHALASEFYGLGLGTPHAVSALHGSPTIGDLLDGVIQTFSQLGFTRTPGHVVDDTVRIAILGRPNVGKSSLINRLLGQERQIVSDLSGTTRDAIDTPLRWNDRDFVLIDTAGIRRKSKVDYGVELFSVDRAWQALRRATITVLVIDAKQGLTDQDKRLIEESNEKGNGLLVAVNKWDTLEDKDSNATRRYREKLVGETPSLKYVPTIFISAKTGQRVEQILSKALEVATNHQRRIQTSLINQIVLEALDLSPPPPVKGKRFKVYYAVQVAAAPPTIVLFCNQSKLLPATYKRYLEHQLRQHIDFDGTPLRLVTKPKSPPKPDAQK